MSNAQSEKNEIALGLFKVARQSVGLTSGEITMLQDACTAQVAKYVNKATATSDEKERKYFCWYACKYRRLKTLLDIERVQLETYVEARTNTVYRMRQQQRRKEAAAKRKLAKAGKAVAK